MNHWKSSGRWLLTVAVSLVLAHCEVKPALCRTHRECVRTRTIVPDADAGQDASLLTYEQRGFCSGFGACMRECEQDRDCPCGAFCAQGCGVCLRANDHGPATCATRPLPDTEVMGLCRADIAEWQALANSDERKQRTLQCPDAGVPTCNGYVGGRIEFPVDSDGGARTPDAQPPADTGVAPSMPDATATEDASRDVTTDGGEA